MDEEKAKGQQIKQEEQDASEKGVKTGAKALATAYGGPAGGKLVDMVSKTPQGKAFLNNAAKDLNRNPNAAKAMRAANKSGLLDAADKAVDATNGDTTSVGGLGSSIGGEKKEGTATLPSKPSLGLNQSKSNDASTTDMGEESSDNSTFSSKMFAFMKQRKFLFISIFGSLLLFVIIAIAAVALLATPAGAVIDFFSGIKDILVGFGNEEDEREKEMKDYYKKLEEVQEEMYEKYHVCIDINLITASLIIEEDMEYWLNDGKEHDDIIEDNPNYNPDDPNNNNPETTLDYKRMKKYVKVLALMQIKNKMYSLDKKLKAETGYYCGDRANVELVKKHNEDSFETTFFHWLNGVKRGDLDSETAEKVARHDIGGVHAFFSRKVNEEKNYEYYIYQPAFNSDGTCTDSYAKSLLPKTTPELSIGNLKTMESAVFYWNLVNSFVPDYYKEYIDAVDPNKKLESVKKIAEKIYLLYNDMGPSQTCKKSNAYAGPSSLCPDGVTVEGEGTFDLEEYVAGVVTKEAYTSEGMEALKAQAVAARSYVLKKTDYCTTSISNSTNAQTFTRDINDRAREAANATKGEILVDKEGKVFEAMYDSFCYEDSDCPDSTKNSDGTYTVTYQKEPYGEKHKITLSDPSQYKRILSGQGHAHGMSQLVSYQLAKEGKGYRDILSYFYSSNTAVNLVLSPTTTDGSQIIQGAVTNYLAAANTTIEEFNQNIYSQVIKSGVGTREGVVAAATTLVSDFYNLTGYKLPYELTPSGKYSGYGMDPNWGTNTGDSSYPLNGLDCSGFISWAIHNGGFAYEAKNAQGWGNAGKKRSWSSGVTDNTAQPGDLIYNAPASNNGTSGHIRMIIGVTNEGYVVAEASSKQNGIRIKNISFTSRGSYYLVDMSDYYASATKVTDYPM